MADRSSVRKPPYLAVHRLHLPRQPGKCDWCGGPQEERTPVRKQLRLRHQRCDDELSIICRPEVARDAVWKRDKGMCRECGVDCSTLATFKRDVTRCEDVMVEATRRWKKADTGLIPDGGAIALWRPYTPVICTLAWAMDHIVPLWSVADMPDLQRIEYFKLANLQVLCDPCHDRKTAGEAARRAKHSSQAARRRGDAKGLPF
jgi:5-methylcytosine-specific restriction endonuclease McrA